jgi:nucleotide-binding universal stress UspA family protein
MINFDRIVFPVDLSEECRRIAPFVKAMATRFDAELTLLHVIEFPASWYGPPEGVAWEVLSDADRLRVERTEAFRHFLADDFGDLLVKREVAEGEPAPQINCYAKTAKAGLIMMPTHGFGTFRRLLLGSVVAKVLHDAQCPVWTGVHSKGMVMHNAERLRRVLCAVDTSPKDAKVVRWALELANQQEAELRVVHAVAGAGTRSGIDTPFREFLFKVAGEDMDKLLRDANAAGKADVSLVGGRAEHVIHDLAFEWDADLVVIGRGADHALGRLRSNAYAIIRESPCPVISV